ncbi:MULTISPECIES: sensor histidine kinase [unclassified Streptomyces]|uniref:sensor histidine kinase n=1 Tax=unclassified Streptomyces TaxID=2593676 RepID=UPI0035DB5879
MSVPAPPSQQRPAKAPLAMSLAVLSVSAVAAGAAAALGPANAQAWTLTVTVSAWACVAVAFLVSNRLVRQARSATAQHEAEAGRVRTQAAQQSAETAHALNVTLPTVAKLLWDGTTVADALTSSPPPADPQLRRLVDTFAASIEEGVKHAARLNDERAHVAHELERVVIELEQLTQETLPHAIARLREGRSADTVFAEIELPRLPVVRLPAESFVRELARSERRASAAQAASAKALSRVQAKAVSMLADLREMQDRHGEEVFGDLLKLDHSTSQLGLMTDRLALLMGGRSSRAWNKPIIMESILRGAVGRIAAYQRVRLNSSTTAAVSGFAAEGVMHLLAELMDNAANFSPPIDEVQVYVEERSAGIVVTIEDSGLRMADAAMRRAEEAVSGQLSDLASLQGTRLGLAVVGGLAQKYGISVNYRPSSRGGTGVVVLLPPQILAQQRDPAPHQAYRSPPAPAPRQPTLPTQRSTRTESPEPERRPSVTTSTSTPNGLPVRAPGRTMAEAERERDQRRSEAVTDGANENRPRRDAGSRFGAFHRGRRTGAENTGAGPEPESNPESDPSVGP